MVWISSTYLDNAIGSDQVTALGLTSASARLLQYELQARSTVISALQYAGYPSPDATLSEVTDEEQVTAAFLKKMCAAIILRDAFSLIPGIALTEAAQAAISQGLTMLDAVYDKKLPVPGLQPNTLDGYGGVKFNTDLTVATPTTRPVWNLRGSSF